VIASITVSEDAASPPAQRAGEAEPTIATTAATLSSKLAAEDTPLTEAERALMRQYHVGRCLRGRTPCAAAPAATHTKGELAMTTTPAPELTASAGRPLTKPIGSRSKTQQPARSSPSSRGRDRGGERRG
jgi:hypothetical protein